MRTDLFDYYLPKELIAQKPAEPRHSSKLMLVYRSRGEIQHCRFFQIIDYLNRGDCLVINETKVFPARLFGEKVKTKGQVEILLLKEVKNGYWEVICKPARRLKNGTEIRFNGESLTAMIVKELANGHRIISFNLKGDRFWKEIKRIGLIPMPPYIKGGNIEPERYQTIFARHERSIAAPTAGLHFSSELLKKIKMKGILLTTCSLDVGIDTFLPVREEKVEDHKIHLEQFQISKESAKIINQARANGGRIISVGTTTARVLETVVDKNGKVYSKAGETDLFIYPSYKFKAVDILLTNFHLPRSTLMMMVSAFAGFDLIKEAYQEAIKQEYSFYSFGDAMLIL